MVKSLGFYGLYKISELDLYILWKKASRDCPCRICQCVANVLKMYFFFSVWSGVLSGCSVFSYQPTPKGEQTSW